MIRGKRTCKILKEIRTQIAEKNDIEYITQECTFQGECKGTCPKCEAEVRYLENELRKHQQLGKVVTIAGISLGVAGSFAACGNSAQESNSQIQDSVKVAQLLSTPINLDSLQPATPPDLVKTMICTTADNFGAEPITLNIAPEVGEIIIYDGVIVDSDSSFDEEQPQRFPDIKAEFPGGNIALLKFLIENIVYPQDALDEGGVGTVIVEFVVQTDGSVDNVTVIIERHPSLDQEAIRVIQTMPKWKPAKSNNIAVSSYFQLPVEFKPLK